MRSDTEILENYNLALSEPSAVPGLALQWSWDVIGGTPCTYNGITRSCETDLSGRGNNGLLGALPTVSTSVDLCLVRHDENG